MATAMLTERGLRRKILAEEKKAAAAAAAAAAASNPSPAIQTPPTTTTTTTRKATKRKSTPKTPKPTTTIISPPPSSEQNNNVKRQRLSPQDSQGEMLAVYQPWVIQTYGDLAKTKTITLKKYARILRTLRGEEVVSADNSKFRFWVKAKGFHMGAPPGYDAKPADGIVGRHSVCDLDEGIPAINDKVQGSAKDPPLYVPNAPFKNSTGEPVYRKVAVVENFFDIIYNVHVELEGRPGKHAGQKRTYRTITETYAFLPREAVTRFLLGCTDCQKHPRSPSPLSSVLPTPSPSPTLPACTETGAAVVGAAAVAVLVAQPEVSPQYNNNNNVVGSTDAAGTGNGTTIPTPFINGTDDSSPSNVTATTAITTPKHSPRPDENLHASPKPPGTPHPSTPGPTPDPVEANGETAAPMTRRSSNPLDVCNLTARDPPKNQQQRKRRKLNHQVAEPLVNGLVVNDKDGYASGNSTSTSNSNHHHHPPPLDSPLSLTTATTTTTAAPCTSPSLPPAVPTHSYTTSTVTVTTTTAPAAVAASGTVALGPGSPLGVALHSAVTVVTGSPGVQGGLSVGVSPTAMVAVNGTTTPTPTQPTPKLWSPVASIEREQRQQQQERLLQQQQQQQQQQQRRLRHQQLYSGFNTITGELQQTQPQMHQQQQQTAMPITSTYLKYMRSLGCSDVDAMQLDAHNRENTLSKQRGLVPLPSLRGKSGSAHIIDAS